MSLKFDVRQFSEEKREDLAWSARNREDAALPRLTYWNYDLCPEHRDGWIEEYFEDGIEKSRVITDRPKDGCRKCAIHFRQHQRVSILWLYLKKRALLADTMGSGKTTSAGGLVALLLQSGEIPSKGRAIIVPRAPALHQWRAELLRMMPRLRVIIAEGPWSIREDLYLSDWDVLLIGPEMLRNDFEALKHLKTALLVTDDVDQLRNADTQTSYCLDKIGETADRYVIMSGTPLQKRLPEMFNIMDGIGGRQAFSRGTPIPANTYTIEDFEKTYVNTQWVDTATGGKRQQVVGYKNMKDFKRRIAPMYLRRTAKDLKDVHLPAIVPDDIMLDLYPAQKRKYEELRRGVIRLMKEEGPKTKHVTAFSKIHYGAAICAGLVNLGEPDGPGSSVKFDWIESVLGEGGDLEDEKVVIFANLKPSIRALQDRFRASGTGFVTIWGEEANKTKRMAAQERFWTDPNCKVLIGTKSIEQSLNLQVSRHLVNVDTIMNPSRMEQLAGRIRRDGSAYKHVFVHNLRTINTQEERYNDVLEREAALAGYVWNENSQLFKALSPLALLQLISG